MRRALIPLVIVICGFVVVPPLIHRLFPPELPAAKLSIHEVPRRLPAFKFSDGSGRRITLNHFHGSFVLVNVWATWCLPCKQEMASLNNLASLFEKKDLIIVPISIDVSGASSVRYFYKKLDLNRLHVYVDPSKQVMHALAVIGIPTTILINRDGLEIRRTVGAAKWDAPANVGLIERIVRR